jgi:hypothetical protein
VYLGMTTSTHALDDHALLGGARSRDPRCGSGSVPSPPNSAVDHREHQRRARRSIRPLPRSGLTATMLKLVGTTMLAQEGAVLLHLDRPTEISGLVPHEVEQRRSAGCATKRSLTISIVGIRPRTMRSDAREVVRPDALRRKRVARSVGGRAVDALQQRIDLVL